MTTTSPFPFSTLEVPHMDDTMEMASPYQGHADDFDIDLDVMEDQASNPDRDMTAADDYLDTSHGPTYDQDGANDADMIDDVAEPSMIDTDNHFPEATNNFEMQYEEHKSYEAEMLEDEYDEDIDAPVPELQEEVPTSLEHADTQGTPIPAPTQKDGNLTEEQGQPQMESHPETGAESVDGYETRTQQEYERNADQTDQHTVEESQITNTGSEPTENHVDDTNEADQVDPEAVSTGNSKDDLEDLKEPEEGKEGDETGPPVDGQKEPELEQHEKTEDVHASSEEEGGQGHDQAEHPPLYPVKVYYQDNEISLFPPREGDSSETFFLEDENLAYGSFGKLFESCREVLHDHISENEVLVMDIEALNIQIAEDSLYTHKVTLYQIVDLYLQLCRNDGIEQPEALYLTLSTKLTISAEVSDLLLAASQGKRLSDIHTWESYPEIEGVSAEFDEKQNLEEQHDISEYEDIESEVRLKASGHEQDTSITQQNKHKSQEDDVTGAEALDNGPKDDEHEEVDATSNEVEAPPAEPLSPKDQPYSYVSEEQTSETTATIDQLPETELLEEQEKPEENLESYDDEEEHVEQYREIGELGDAAHPEYEANLDAHETIDTREETQLGVDVDDLEEVHSNEYHDLASEYYEESGSEGRKADGAYQENEDLAEDTVQNDDDPKEIGLNEISATPKSEQSPHLADDSLGITEDPVNPSNDSKNVSQEPEADDIEAGEIVEADHTSLLPTDNIAEDLTFDDDEEYLDLGIADDLGASDAENEASPGPVSTKRSREADDELDLPETPTPDAKRSRSS